MTSPTANRQTIIMGGGLAGLTLAIQLRHELPNIPVTVIERQPHPVDTAAHKVGESTVELATHYLNDVLQLSDHLKGEQLPKLGLRFFFPSMDKTPTERFSQCLEMGARVMPHSPSYQLDRGILENFLAEHAQSLGVEFIDNAKVTAVVLNKGEETHHVTFEALSTGKVETREANWLIDACSRHSPIKRQQKLAKKNAHDVNAVWFRIQDKLDLNQLAGTTLGESEPAPERWLSTNHLMGQGYWVWLIPLSSGSTSVGIVADEKFHAFDAMKDFDGAMLWLHQNEPAVADMVDKHRHQLQDFRVLRHFSHDCRQVYSADRWFLTGEAGAFLDPFYSPGSDYIALSNTFITQLIKADINNDAFAQTAMVFDRFYLSMYRNTLAIYQDRYDIFGHSKVMPVKIIWDFAVYWSFTAFLFIQGRMKDAGELLKLLRHFEDLGEKNQAMQSLLVEWAKVEETDITPAYVDPFDIEELETLNKGLYAELDDDAFREQLAANLALLDNLHNDILGVVQERHPELVTTKVVHRTGSITKLMQTLTPEPAEAMTLS